MHAERHTISLTTDGSGNATAYSPVVSGRVLMVQYVKTDFENTVDITVTAEATAQPIMTLTDQTASAPFYPRRQVHDGTGAGLTLDGTRVMVEPVVVAQDRIKVAVAQGGSGKSGTIVVIVG